MPEMRHVLCWARYLDSRADLFIYLGRQFPPIHSCQSLFPHEFGVSMFFSPLGPQHEMSNSRKDEDLVRILSATCNAVFLLYLPYGRKGLLKARPAVVPVPKWLVLVKVVSQPPPHDRSPC